MANWKLRYQYVAMGSVVGTIVGLVIGAVIYLATIGIFWVYIYGDTIWPEWTNMVVFWSFWAPLVLTWCIALMIWYRRAVRTESQTPEERDRVFRKNLNLTLALLAVFCSIAVFVIVSANIKSGREKVNKAISDKLVPQLNQVESVSLAQEGKNFKVIVKTKPPYNNKYQVVVYLRAVGFAQCPLTQRVETVTTATTKDTFDFIIPYDEILERYRTELESYVSDFSQEFGIDEMIEVTAALELYETPEYSHDQVKRLKLPFSEQKAIALFYFNCSKDACSIEQNPEEPKKQ